MSALTAFARYKDAGSNKNIQRIGGLDHDRQLFNALLSMDNVVLDDEFDVDTINLDRWTTNAGTGATAFAVPATPLVGGQIRAATGTDATASNRRVNLYGAPIWLGDNGILMEVLLTISAITSVQLEVGFIDAMTSITTAAPVVSDIDTPSFAGGVGDAAVVALDTAQTLATMGLACLGSGSLNTGSKDALGTTLPTAATQMLVRIGILGNTVIVNIDRKDGSSYNVVRTSGIEGGTLVRPWIFVGGLIATSRTLDIDRIRIISGRAAL